MELEYHFSVIYNDAKSPLLRTDDTNLSLKFTELLVRKCNPNRWKSYYKDRDMLPGQNIFDELTRVVKSSRFVIMVFTEGFVRDCWSRYQRQTAVKMLIDDKSSKKLIPILVGVHTLPDDLGTFEPVFFFKDSAAWESDESVQTWNKVIRCLESADRGTYIYRREQGVQETRNNRLRPELLPGSNPTVESTTSGFETEQGDASRLVAQPTATIELSRPVTQSSPETSISLRASPIVRPPPTTTPSQPIASQVPNQNSFSDVHSYHTDESTNTLTHRQLSLSRDADLQTDYESIGTGPPPQVVSPSTDSGFSTVNPEIAASNTSLCTMSPDSSEAVDIIDRKGDGESSNEAESADNEDAGPQPQVVSPSTDSVDSGIPAPNTNSSTAAPAPIDSGLSATDTSLCTATPVGSGLSACNTSLYITSPDSCETVDIIDRKIDGESSDEAENADKEVLPNADKDTKEFCTARSLMYIFGLEILSWLTKPECAYRG